MYESPIKIIESTTDLIYKEVVKKKEDAIFAEIQSAFNVDLDKAELIRALQYDRDQYNKGYQDGQPKWISVKDRLPEVGKKVLCCGPTGGLFIARTRVCEGRVLIIDDKSSVQRKATNWMPLPQPPKGE